MAARPFYFGTRAGWASSLAIRPAGSSAPLLIFKPVLSRWRLVESDLLFCAKTRCAMSELTLVLILLMMMSLRDGGSRRFYSGDTREGAKQTRVCRCGQTSAARSIPYKHRLALAVKGATSSSLWGAASI